MIYLLHGEEEFLRAEALAAIKAGLGAPEFAELNTTLLDGARLGQADLIHACDVVPFLAPRRLVVVDGALAAWSKKAARRRSAGKAAPESEAEQAVDDGQDPRAALIAYLPQVPETTDLVFLEPALVRKSDPVHKTLDSLAGSGRARILLCQYDGPWWKQEEWLRQWTQRRARARSIAIDPAALQTLTETVGNNLRLIDQELSKLQAYVAGARPVGVQDVRLLVSAAHEISVFDMVQALAGGDGRQAVNLMQDLLTAGESPLALLGMIAWQFRLLLQVNELAAQGMDQNAVGAALKQKPYTIKKIWPQAQRYSLETLEWVMERLLETDVAIKTGQMEDRVALDVLVAELAAARDER